MDLIISKGLKEKGYDALILENQYKGKVIDTHIFKFDNSTLKTRSQLTDIWKMDRRNSLRWQLQIIVYPKGICTWFLLSKRKIDSVLQGH